MSERTFVVIFFFWAALTIITPTLVHLSDIAKSQQQSNGERSSEAIKARRMMMGYAEKSHTQTPNAQKNSTQTPTPAPAPAPASASDMETLIKRKEKAYLDKVLSDSMKLVVNKTIINVA